MPLREQRFRCFWPSVDCSGRRSIRPCSREDSNLHGLPHTVLSRTRLPVPPRELKKLAGEADLYAGAVQPQSTATFFARPAFQRVRFTRFAQRAEKIGIVSRHHFIFFGWFGHGVLPCLERRAIKF